MSDQTDHSLNGASRSTNDAASGRDKPSSAPKSSPQRPFRRALFSWLPRLRKQRNGEDLRDTIEELIDVNAGDAEDAIKPDEGQLIRNILHLNKLTAADVMVPRADIIAVDAQTSVDGLIEVLSAETHSRLPVYEGTLDNVIGMVHIKDLLPYWSEHRDFSIDKVKRETLFAAPSMPVLDLLTEMRNTHIHLALVVDEFGGIDGLVSIEDLVEEIVGEIEDEHDAPDILEILEERAGIATADARLTIEQFEDTYGQILSEEEREEVDTLGGLVFYLANRVPSRGELIKHPAGIEFEVIEADPRRIHRLRLRNLPPRQRLSQAAE